MNLIDEDGNLFGKVNIIDVLVVMVLAAILIAGLSLDLSAEETDSPASSEATPTPAGNPGEATETTIVFRATEQPDFVVNSIEPGSVSGPAIVAIDDVTANRTGGKNTVFVQLRQIGRAHV